MRKVPSLRRHKPSSQAVVTLSGHDFYLGLWPANRKSAPPDCQAKYERLIAEWLTAGRPTSPSTLWRWTRHGVPTPAGVIRLETSHLAGRLITSKEAVRRFLTTVSAAKALHPSANQSQPPSDKSITSDRQTVVKARLDAIGI